MSAALAAPSSATRLSGFITTSGSVRVGGHLQDTVTVLPKAARAVTVQYRRAGTRGFTNAPTGITSPRGVITLRLRPPAAGRWQFRAVVAPTKRATRFVSSTRTVVASGRADMTRISGFDTTSATISPGDTVGDDVVISPRATRVVTVQARAPGSQSFVIQSSGTSSRAGDFRAVYRPSSAGAWGFRLVVPGTSTARPVISPTRLITAEDQPGPDRTAPSPVAGLAVSGLTDKTATLSWTNPPDIDFAGVTIRRAAGPIAPISPTAGTPVADTGKTDTTFTDTAVTADTQYSYALFAHDGIPNFAATATMTLRTKVVPDVTAPGPVTDLDGTVTQTTVELSWTNPPDTDVTGVVIRRAVGDTAPVTVTDGVPVTDAPAASRRFFDRGLDPATEYSYAVFAHDGAPNYADAVNVTRTTNRLTTEAVLSVNAKLTAGSPAAFDLSGSVAAPGATLVSGSLDYGDGQKDSFDEPFGPVDFWNTLHTYATAGTETLTVTVTDSDGISYTDHRTVTVFAAPTASISVNQNNGVVTFALQATTLDDTRLTSYALNVSGDDNFHLYGSTAPPDTQAVPFVEDENGVSLDVSFLPGNYAVQFIVTNDAGGSAAATETFTVR